MKIIKFGGSSAATPERIKAIIEIVGPRLQEDVALVFSAFGGVTDQLIQLSDLALGGSPEYKLKLEQLEKRHLDAVRELTKVSTQSGILAQVKVQINELEDVLHGIFLVKERTPRTLDYIMSFGERLSAFIICEAFKDRGLSTEYLDARRVVRTDNQFGYAKVDFETTHKMVRDHFKNHGDVQIITGLLGKRLKVVKLTTIRCRSGAQITPPPFLLARCRHQL